VADLQNRKVGVRFIEPVNESIVCRHGFNRTKFPGVLPKGRNEHRLNLCLQGLCCHCEPFAFCHSDPDPERSEGEGEESQDTAQGKPCSEQSESIREVLIYRGHACSFASLRTARNDVCRHGFNRAKTGMFKCVF